MGHWYGLSDEYREVSHGFRAVYTDGGLMASLHRDDRDMHHVDADVSWKQVDLRSGRMFVAARY
ncbi:hypothetical protein NGM37_30570, partial [Streptomyces sp. TRM76130]|nr:hypothetical protein [Streptomyces sp. TRM76130]